MEKYLFDIFDEGKKYASAFSSSSSEKEMEVNVMMFGGRRCGKTSILAAMQHNFEQVFGNSSMVITVDDTDTIFTLEEKRREMEQYFVGRRRRSFVPDDNPTLDMNTYSFNIGLKGKIGTKICMNFIDYPGEWFARKDKYDELLKIMNKCNVMMIAIDTPHLMEETHSSDISKPGEFNDVKNYSYKISEMLKQCFAEHGKDELPKMILFVPIKCEKYIYSDRMAEVVAKIKGAYGTAIQSIEEFACEMAITPIVTLGGAEFAEFESDEEGELIIDNNKLPQARYISSSRQVNGFEPKYCEQPLVYTLIYLFDRAQRIKDRPKGNFVLELLDILTDKFFEKASGKDFLMQKDTLRRCMETSDDGYTIIRNPLGF